MPKDIQKFMTLIALVCACGCAVSAEEPEPRDDAIVRCYAAPPEPTCKTRLTVYCVDPSAAPAGFACEATALDTNESTGLEWCCEPRSE